MFCSQHFSWSWRRTNTIFIVPLLALKPHWLSRRISSAMVGMSLWSRTLASTLPEMESRVIPDNWSNQTFHPCFWAELWWPHRKDLVAACPAPSSRQEDCEAWHGAPEPHASIFLVGCHQLLLLCDSMALVNSSRVGRSSSSTMGGSWGTWLMAVIPYFWWDAINSCCFATLELIYGFSQLFEGGSFIEFHNGW